MINFRLNLNPVPASRPRVSKWGTYYGARHKAFAKEALDLLGDLREQGVLPSPPLSGRLRVWVVFSLKKPKTTKLKIPRPDIDNLQKLTFDCCTGYVWEDDRQIEKVCAFKCYAEDEGYIDLIVEEIPDETDFTEPKDSKAPEVKEDNHPNGSPALLSGIPPCCTDQRFAGQGPQDSH